MAIQVHIDPAKTYQTIEGFGASGAWWAQLVGGAEDHVREQILRLLYDKTEGLGMNTYRCNLGGGSKESGKGRFGEVNRRASSFDDGEDSYDWSRDAQAQWCLQEAVRLGADEIVLFANSPPERWTVTGTAQGRVLFKPNLRRDCEAKFVRYVLDVAEHFIAEGVPVKFLSPINEPFGPWIERLCGQEGCHYRPSGVRRLMRLFAREMDKRPTLHGVLLSGAENNDLRLMNKTYTRAVMDDEVIRGRLDGIDVHGYVFKPLKCLKGVKRRFRRYMDRHYPGAPIRMTEWTEMRGGRDLGMESALVQADTMFEDLSVLNAVSWQHWIAVSEYDFCDGLLYIDKTASEVVIPKRYYAFGNFTRFVPRGAVRIGIETPGAPKSLRSLAFRTESEFVLIFANRGETPLALALAGQAAEAEMWVTSEERSLEPERVVPGGFALPGRSVCTVILPLRSR